MMKLTPAQKQLLINVYIDKELHDYQTTVSPTYKPALTLVEMKLATMRKRGASTRLKLTEEGNELAKSLTSRTEP